VIRFSLRPTRRAVATGSGQNQGKKIARRTSIHRLSNLDQNAPLGPDEADRAQAKAANQPEFCRQEEK
jgi:hypothetical protein